MNAIDVRCDDCGHTATTTDRTLIGQPCSFFGPGAGEDDGDEGCAGTYRRRWTAPAVAFKGEGFYTTDSRGTQ